MTNDATRGRWSATTHSAHLQPERRPRGKREAKEWSRGEHVGKRTLRPEQDGITSPRKTTKFNIQRKSEQDFMRMDGNMESLYERRVVLSSVLFTSVGAQ